MSKHSTHIRPKKKHPQQAMQQPQAAAYVRFTMHNVQFGNNAQRSCGTADAAYNRPYRSLCERPTGAVDRLDS